MGYQFYDYWQLIFSDRCLCPHVWRKHKRAQDERGEREIINDRLEKFKIKILQGRFEIIDPNLLANKLEEKAINFNQSLDPITWIFDLFRAAGSQEFNLNNYGIKSLNYFNPKTIKDEINDELLELSEAHHERYFKKS